MAGTPSISLTVFEDHLTRIEVGIQFVAKALSAKKCTPGVINWGADKYAVGEVRAFLNAEAYPEELLCNANYLSSVAAFEEFLRQILVSAISTAVAKLRSFDELDTKIQDIHIKATGRLLARRSNPPQQLSGLNFFDLCRRIGTCIPGSTKFEVNTEALCLLEDSLALESCLETLSMFGYKITLDTLGAKNELGEKFRTTGTRETRKALEVFLSDMIRQRNRIAHTGTTASEVTNEILLEHLGILRAIARALSLSLK